MIITIISEQRSGSTRLYSWLKKFATEFIVLGEPYNKNSFDYKKALPYDTRWIDTSKNYIINEKLYLNGDDITQLTNISDQVVCLYREDEKAQIESFMMADITNNWHGSYTVDPHIIDNIDRLFKYKKDYFIELKREFKNFRETNHFKTFSYEELFYGNKIKELTEYLGLKIDEPFPFGKKYRKERKIERLI